MNQNRRRISFPSGPLEGGEPKKQSRNGKSARVRREEPREFVHGPVKVPDPLLKLLIQHGRRHAHGSLIRIAVTNCIHQSPGGSDYPLADLWDSIGRWASNVRGMKEIEGITQRHEAWAHIQRLRFAMGRATNDPTLQKKLKYPINRFLSEALLAWDNAMANHFGNFPDDLMTPDEFAGMVEAPSANSVQGISIFKKPPKPAPRTVRQEEAETLVVVTKTIRNGSSRNRQTASLFGAKIVRDDAGTTDEIN